MSCISLASITIPGSVTMIGEAAFYSCAHLTSISFLGLVSPETGLEWIKLTSPAIRGHAYAASNFPVPGSTFYGLTMGVNVAPSVPGAPTNISTTPGDSYALVAWVAPNDIGGSPITGYRIYRSATETGNFTLIASPTITTYNDTGATNGQTYWYKVSAVNVVGEGALSSATSVVLPSDVSVMDITMLLWLIVIVVAVALLVLTMLVVRKRKRSN
jgi:hypothetical protein